MKNKTIDKLARIAEEQRNAAGLPTFKTIYAVMPQDQKNRFWDYINGQRKDGKKMCMKMNS